MYAERAHVLMSNLLWVWLTLRGEIQQLLAQLITLYEDEINGVSKYRGRPALAIDEEQLRFLLSYNSLQTLQQCLVVPDVPFRGE